MIKEEVCKEYCEFEGDLYVKGCICNFQCQVVQCCMMVDVFKVDVIVINLMYYVVVLCYFEKEGGVLCVLVKGVDMVVVKICELGMEYKIFILEVFLLVCVLYCYIEIGYQIFEVLYVVVVEVFVYVYQLCCLYQVGGCVLVCLIDLLVFVDMDLGLQFGLDDELEDV